MLKTIILGLGLVALLAAGVYIANQGTGRGPENNQPAGESENQPPVDNNNQKQPPVTENPTAEIETSLGNITVELFPGDAPKTVENFLKLTREGFYDGIAFHRVIKGFMIQVGDPLTKDPGKTALWGTGGPGYKFADELDPATESYKRGYVRGTLAMANAGPNTNGSQFFIMHADGALPHAYTIFGRVTEGLDVVDKIATTPTAPGDRPLTTITITKVVIN